jgi:hypothetical protein
MAQLLNSSRFATILHPSSKTKGKKLQPIAVLEFLEDRRLLSTVVPAPVAPIPAVVLHELPEVGFTTDLGNFVADAPASRLSADINWSDGTTSTGMIVADGSVAASATGASATEMKYEVDGTHTYKNAGVYPITATVLEKGPTGTTYVLLLETFHDTAIVAHGNTNLDGTISGTYVAAPSPVASPTAIILGAEYIFTGTGTAGVLGPVAAKGDIILPSPIAATGVATGTLTLTSISTMPADSGSVTLKLTGPIEKGKGTLPATLSYVITGGTGAFAGATGVGTIAITLGTDNSFTFDITSLLPPPTLPPVVLV